MDDLLPGLARALDAHPLFVHFPIALWSFALLLHLAGQSLRRKDLLAAARWSLFAGVITAFATVATGYLASDGLGHDSPGHDLVHVHRDFMLAATAMAAVTAALSLFLRDSKALGSRWLVSGGLLLTVAITTLGADRGAMLVYGYGMGVETAPATAESDHLHDESPHEEHGH